MLATILANISLLDNVASVFNLWVYRFFSYCLNTCWLISTITEQHSSVVEIVIIAHIVEVRRAKIKTCL